MSSKNIRKRIRELLRGVMSDPTALLINGKTQKYFFRSKGTRKI